MNETIKLSSNSNFSLNTLDLCEELTKEEIIAKVKELYSLHSKFADEHNGQKINFSDIKEMCKKNKFDISDDELMIILQDL